MAKFLNRIIYIMEGHYLSLLGMACLFTFISALEIFGIGMIGPFIAVATTPDLVETNYWLNSFYKLLNLNSENQFLLVLGLLLVIAFAIKSWLAFHAQKQVFNFGYHLKSELICRLMKAYMEAPYSFHLANSSDSLILSICGTTDYFSLGVIMPSLTSISNLMLVLALTWLLLRTNAMAVIFILLLMFIAVVIWKQMKDRLARWKKQGWEANGKMLRTINEGIGSFKETRILGCETYFEQQMEDQAKNYAMGETLSQSYNNLPRYVIEAFMISFLVVFTLLFNFFNQGEGQNINAILGIFALASVRLLPAVGNLIGGINTVKANAFSVAKVYSDLKQIEQEKLKPRGGWANNSLSLTANEDERAISLREKIVLENISFHYPNTAKNALNNISLTINKGESIGLIGKSGSGKTTLVDVLLGLFTPQSGDIKVDGISVYDNLRAWQNMLGYAPQSIFLVNDSLERNIAFGVPEHLIDQQQLWRAIEMAQLKEVVEQLSDGIKTVLGERGVLLSGGQIQRVGIARLLYHERDVLVFDEATSALDTKTEQHITEATKILRGNKTMIIIAHRLQTLEHCDRIYQLEQGRIIKSGSYREIVLNSSERN